MCSTLHIKSAPILQLDVRSQSTTDTNELLDAYGNGRGRFAIYVVPSLDVVIYKLAGNDGAYGGPLTASAAQGERYTTRRWKAPGQYRVVEWCRRSLLTPGSNLRTPSR